MTAWSPDVWNSIGVIGLLLAVSAFHAFGYFRGFIVPGRHHDAIVAARDREISNLLARGAEDAKTIHVQTQAIAKTTAAEETATQLLAAVREIAERERR